MYTSFVRVFRSPHSWGLALTAALLVFLLATLASNVMLIWQFVVLSDASLVGKVKLLWYLADSITTNFSLLAASYTIAIALLSGVNIALFAYYVRTRRREEGSGIRSAGIGIGGFISGLLGLGCAACGSALVLPILSVLGASGLFALLPLRGEEFGIIGTALLLFSAILLSRRIADPLVCPVE